MMMCDSATIAAPVTPMGENGYTCRSSNVTSIAATMSRSACSMTGGELRLLAPHSSSTRWVPTPCISLPPPEDDRGHAGSDLLNRMAHRMDAYRFRRQASAPERLIDHPPHRRLHLL